jgi:hypothetical protein
MKYLWFLLLIGCNPVKQVLKDQTKFDLVAKEVVRRGYCVNDTIVIEKIKDSVVYKDSIIERINNVPCKDFDSTIGRARIKVSSGVLTYTAKDSVILRVRTITNNIRDKKLEEILKGDISNRDSIILDYRKTVLDLQTANKDAKSDLAWMKFKLWGLIVMIVAWTVGKAYLKRYLKTL